MSANDNADNVTNICLDDNRVRGMLWNSLNDMDRKKTGIFMQRNPSGHWDAGFYGMTRADAIDAMITLQGYITDGYFNE